MKKVMISILLGFLMLTSCANTSVNVKEPSESFEASETESLYSEDTVSAYTEDVDLTAIGGDTIDWDYAYRYYDVPFELIKYVGNDDFQEWAAED